MSGDPNADNRQYSRDRNSESHDCCIEGLSTPGCRGLDQTVRAADDHIHCAVKQENHGNADDPNQYNEASDGESHQCQLMPGPTETI